MTTTIGIRELRQHASRYVAASAAGERITITDRGEPVAMLVPLGPAEQYLHRVLTRHHLIAPTRPRRVFGEDTPLEGPPLSVDIDADREERDVLGA